MRRIDAPHGCLVYRHAPGRTAEIVDIEVANEFRRTGIGRGLLDALLAELAAGCTVYAFTRESNRIARRWYVALGFRGTRVRGFYGDDDPDAVLYVKRKAEG